MSKIFVFINEWMIYICFTIFTYNTCSKLWIVLGTCRPAYDWLVLRFLFLWIIPWQSWQVKGTTTNAYKWLSSRYICLSIYHILFEYHWYAEQKKLCHFQLRHSLWLINKIRFKFSYENYKNFCYFEKIYSLNKWLY